MTFANSIRVEAFSWVSADKARTHVSTDKVSIFSKVERKKLPHNAHDNQPPVPSAAAAKSLQSCPTLCDPIDSSPPGSSVPGILQARILLEWVAISFSSSSLYYPRFLVSFALLLYWQ